MKAQVESPWREEPRLIASGAALLLLMWIPLFDLLTTETSGSHYSLFYYQSNSILSVAELDFSNHFQLIDKILLTDTFIYVGFGVVILSALLLVIFHIRLMTMLQRYVHPLKFPCLPGYAALIISLILVYYGSAQIAAIKGPNTRFLDHDAKLFSLIALSPFLFTFSLLWDRSTISPFSFVRLPNISRQIIRILFLSLVLLGLSFAAGWLAIETFILAWDVSFSLNGGQAILFHPIPMLIALGSSLLFSLLIVGCHYLLLWFFRHSPVTSWRSRTRRHGLILFMTCGVAFLGLLLIKGNRLGFPERSFSGTARIDFLADNRKSVLLFNYPEDDLPRIVPQSFNFNFAFIEDRLFPVVLGGNSITYSVTKENLEKVESYLATSTTNGPHTSPAWKFLSFGYLYLMKPDQSIYWLHQISQTAGAIDWRESERVRLYNAPIRAPYSTYLSGYLDESKWRIGDCDKLGFVVPLSRFGYLDLAREYHKKTETNCPGSTSSSKFFDVPDQMPLQTGSIQGYLDFWAPLKHPVRLGLLRYHVRANSDDNGRSRGFYYWDYAEAIDHLVDAIEIAHSGPFLFQNLAEGSYVLVLLADPDTIPSDSWQVNLINPPGYIELSKSKPAADLGVMAIEISDAPIFDKSTDPDIIKLYTEQYCCKCP